MIINAGIVEIVYAEPYDDELSLSMLAEAGIRLRCLEG
jgi:deoxycytidylate deaminase